MNNEDLQKWQVLILGIMMSGGIDFLDEIINRDIALARAYEYERMKGE